MGANSMLPKGLHRTPRVSALGVFVCADANPQLGKGVASFVPPVADSQRVLCFAAESSAFNRECHIFDPTTDQTGANSLCLWLTDLLVYSFLFPLAGMRLRRKLVDGRDIRALALSLLRSHPRTFGCELSAVVVYRSPCSDAVRSALPVSLHRRKPIPYRPTSRRNSANGWCPCQSAQSGQTCSAWPKSHCLDYG